MYLLISRCQLVFKMSNFLGIPLSAALSTTATTRDDLIVHYSNLGYSTKEICGFLNDVHGNIKDLRVHNYVLV